MTKKMVKVIVDRPLGSYHPIHKDLYYPINYGYVEGIIAGDGEEQDAYIIGINEPLKHYTGELIAIIHRENDVEDKWVIVPKGIEFSKDEIMKIVNFQEHFFDSSLEML